MRGIEQYLQVDAATLGALKYAGTWNASTNTPTLASGVGTQGQYYVVSVAGSTNLDGETNWQVGDWAVFNGSVWQKVDGGSTGLLSTLTVTGNTYLATTSGNVGIGAIPTGYGKLEVYQSANNRILFSGASAYGNNAIAGINDVGAEVSMGIAGSPVAFYTNATERMRITSTGDVGIGTSSPAVKLDVTGTINASSSLLIGSTYGVLYGDSGNSLVIAADNGNAGANTRMQFNVDGSERMRIDSSGNLGLGATPSAWGLGKAIEVGIAGNSVWGVQNADLRLAANMYYDGANYRYANSGISARYDVGNASLGGHAWYTAPSGTAGNAISFTQVMTLDTSGNLGLGVTPSAWVSTSRALQILPYASVSCQSNGAANFGFNFYESSVNTFSYTTTDQAGRFSALTDGSFAWFTAPSGTAGNTISFTQAMTLDASGNLLVGATSGAARIISAVPDGTYSFGAVGTTKAIRISHSSTASKIEGVDSTLSASYQPLTLNGSYLAFETSVTERLRITSAGNIHTPAGATTMTNGFFYIPAAAGVPTGVPTAITGTVPMYYDTTNNKFYVYNGAWKSVTLT